MDLCHFWVGAFSSASDPTINGPHLFSQVQRTLQCIATSGNFVASHPFYSIHHSSEIMKIIVHLVPPLPLSGFELVFLPCMYRCLSVELEAGKDAPQCICPLFHWITASITPSLLNSLLLVCVSLSRVLRPRYL